MSDRDEIFTTELNPTCTCRGCVMQTERDQARAVIERLKDALETLAAEWSAIAGAQMIQAESLARRGDSESVRPHVRCLTRAQAAREHAGELRGVIEETHL